MGQYLFKLLRPPFFSLTVQFNKDSPLVCRPKNSQCSSVMVWVILESARREVSSLQIRVGLIALSPIEIVIGAWSDHVMVPIEDAVILESVFVYQKEVNAGIG